MTGRMVPYVRYNDNADHAGLLYQQMYSWPKVKQYL